ncbi:Sec39 domain-containing protein [Clohesyomyces aquaticus]|uniref:Sec39 domain-containing protein n=1 Tax=Clohesyomyces aquaticus TaxID=1231657 RepID=A0A1Y1Z7C0_9PLEO|nr:Sec39 domain-containing protein [Clohesyomyces aquaticus]
MAELRELSASHCVLLAVQYATEANISSLRALTARRRDALDAGLILRILLTYLPESLDPSQYTEYLHEIITGSRLPPDDELGVALDTSPVKDVPESKARRKAYKLYLLPLTHSLYQAEPALDPLTSFLIHRSHRIDAETGLLDMVPQLVVPFLDHSDDLRLWFISTVLPLLRLGYEYYSQSSIPSLESFAQMKGRRALDTQLSNLRRADAKSPDLRDPARDLRGVVGPWMCGSNERKRRKLDTSHRRASIDQSHQQGQEQDDWESLFQWLTSTAKDDFALTSSAILSWDGPEDMDLGGYDGGQVYIDEDHQRQLESRYAQSALASLYVVETKDRQTLQRAHSVLVRLGSLLSMDEPRDLHIDVESLPTHDLGAPLPNEYTPSLVQEENMLGPENFLTKPSPKSIHLLELFIFSACLLSSMEYEISIREAAKLYLHHDHAEQFALLKKILHSLSSGPKKDANQWTAFRSRLLWLWNWGTSGQKDRRGIFPCVDGQTIETEIFKALLESSHYGLAIQLYIQIVSEQRPLPLEEIEKIVLATAMHHYDNASNGNRTRGGMKRASDMIATFSPYFPKSTRFQRVQALFAATHALSFYSLILQHGVPFQPVNIRVSKDPLSLLRKVLQQNRRSYTHLDDLISIGQNLVISQPATLMDTESKESPLGPADTEEKKAAAERRVIGMAIEAALDEDDFETAYSYVVNRLSGFTDSPPISSSASTYSLDSNDSDDEEGVQEVWRAAFLAGRHQSSPMSVSGQWGGSTARPDLRRLEQRMELLSQAILLAPPSHLQEVLDIWRDCETEMTRLLKHETAAEERFNDMADRRVPGSFANETVAAVQPRREVGRGAVEEAPMGLFDVARGAAAAFSKSAFPLRASNRPAPAQQTQNQQTRGAVSPPGRGSLDLASDSGSADEGGRVRRRDMVANAVTGGLASGLGWVLGATPVQNPERES